LYNLVRLRDILAEKGWEPLFYSIGPWAEFLFDGKRENRKIGEIKVAMNQKGGAKTMLVDNCITTVCICI
jgi:hypothetical protein